MGFVDTRSDEQLLAEHLAGKPGAFDALVGRYSHELFGFLFRFVTNNALAEDLVQETFLQVHLSAGSFDSARAFKPWLYTIAANKARDHLRFRGRRQVQSLDVGGADGEGPSAAQSLEAEGESITEQLEDQEQRDQVQALIARMPEHLRMILLLGYYQQLPYAEIAEILEIPVGTVKSRLHAAVTHFAKLWNSRSKVWTARPH